MRPIALLASGDEREIMPHFWNRGSAVCYEAGERQIAVFYTPSDIHSLVTLDTPMLQKELARCCKWIRRYGFTKLLISKKLQQSLGNRLVLPDLEIYSGDAVFWQRVPQAVERLVCKGGYLSVMVAETQMRYAPEILRRIARHCRRLILASSSDFTALSEEIYHSYGLVVEPTAYDRETDCDLALIVSGNPAVSRKAVVMRTADKKVRKLLVPTALVPALPVAADPLAAAEAFEEES